MAIISDFEFINGLFSLIFVIISTLIGLRIAIKYFEIKNRIFLLMGISWIGIASPWWGSSLSFILLLIINKPLNLWLYIFINMVLAPILLVLLVTVFTDMKFQDKQKIIQLFFLTFAIIFEIYLFYYLIVDINVLGKLEGNVDVTYLGILRYFLIFIICSFILIGILLSLSIIKSSDLNNKLKGKFLLIAFILWSIGAVCDASLTLTIITLPIVRIILIMSSIFFYIGYFTPKFMKGNL